MHDHTTSTMVPNSATFQHGTKPATPQVNGPTDYRPQMVPFTTRLNNSNPVRQFNQQQHPQHHQQQQHHQQVPSRHIPQVRGTAAPHVPPKQQQAAATNAVTTLLPYCTADIPLNEGQVIALTDVAGSLKELVLLALGAKDGDNECTSRLEGALGSQQAVSSVLDFFSDEFEVE